MLLPLFPHQTRPSCIQLGELLGRYAKVITDRRLELLARRASDLIGALTVEIPGRQIAGGTTALGGSSSGFLYRLTARSLRSIRLGRHALIRRAYAIT